MGKVIVRDEVFNMEPVDDSFQVARSLNEANLNGFRDGTQHAINYFSNLPFLARLWIAFTGNLFG